MFEQDELHTPSETWKDKILDRWDDAKHFPTLVWDWIKTNIFGSIKVWGSILMVYILYTIWTSGGFHGVYYTWKISSERADIIRAESYIKTQEKIVSESKQSLSCLQNQMDRISQGKKVEIGYCKK